MGKVNTPVLALEKFKKPGLLVFEEGVPVSISEVFRYSELLDARDRSKQRVYKITLIRHGKRNQCK